MTDENSGSVDIVSPCHGVPLWINYVYEGRPHMEEQVVDGFECLALGCNNTWDAKGKAQQ